jgi:eukaryotic-like serine/threonine-protein kinase
VTLAAGTKLGPYEILSPIGAGGMGEVYRANDTRLDRVVAVKILPDHISTPEARQRFEREAKTISQLSHPHICALYDVGSHEGTEYLVMEYLEGETLAERLARGPLPLEQTLRYGSEVADALDKAHRRGVVHRDLKPGNVMLTSSGVKLLDFGLAKLTQRRVDEAESLSAVATEGPALTEQGTVIGTLQYMAPEQIEGKEADSRTDIFAFGAMLYEMVTGRKAFSGSARASLITAILSQEPPSISLAQPLASRTLDRLVTMCLRKDPEERWQSARDVASELRWIAQADVEGGGAGSRISRSRWRERLGWAGFAVAAASAAWLALARFRPEPARRAPIRFQVPAPPQATFNALGRDAGPVVVSPDGTRLAFVATNFEGQKLLFVRALGTLAPQALGGTDGASYPFWSPDSRWIGFFAEGKLKKIEAGGGPVQILADAPLGRGGTWNREGVILFTPGAYDPLYRMSAGGGKVQQVTRLGAGRVFSHRWPQFLPDGRHFLYLKWGTFPGPARTEDSLYVASLDSEESTRLLEGNSRFLYASGYLLYVRDETLLAAPFDADLRRVKGAPVPLAQQVLYYPNTGSAVFSVSDNGVLAYQAGAAPVVSELDWFDREGRKVGTVGPPGDYEDPRLSPDGEVVAVNRIDPSNGTANIWLFGVARDTATRFTFSNSFDHYAVWSPDGGRIAFDSNRNGAADVYLKALSGSAEERQLLHSGDAMSPTDWTPDGRALIYERLDPKTKSDLWMLPLSGNRTPIPIMHTDANEVDARVSPDGRWIAYGSDESGKWEVYVAGFPGPGDRWQVSNAGGSEPIWRRDGKELFYLAADRKLMAVAIAPAAGFQVGAPRPLFQTRARYTGNVAYDVTADGKKFLVNTLIGAEGIPPITVDVNWTEAVKR